MGSTTGAASLVYVSAEDDENEIARRAQAIAAEVKLNGARSNLRKCEASRQGVIIPRKGKDSALVIMGESAQVEVRTFYHQLIQRLQALPGQSSL